MLWKVSFLILCIGACASMLLTLRQQRLEAVHQMAMIQRQISEKDEQLLKLRIEIAHGVAPMSVQTLAAALPGERSRLAGRGVDQPLPRGGGPAGRPALAVVRRGDPATGGRA
ncbi:MAG: hypothetical protein ACK48N_07995, partial [Planctomyces sp.]